MLAFTIDRYQYIYMRIAYISIKNVTFEDLIFKIIDCVCEKREANVYKAAFQYDFDVSR